ncbi:hypothetical protein M5689_016154 [Euphorbia peplus]|nr:hypothetical protein M5689_016154 [Euphorbia peplus]
MDPWAVHVKNSTYSPFWVRNYSMLPDKPNAKIGVLEFRIFNPKLASFSSSSATHHSLLIRAMAKKNSNGNGDRSIPEGDGSKGSDTPDGKKSDDNSFQKSHHVNLDWREFRAKMVVQEQAQTAEVDAASQGGNTGDSKPLGLKWAHPISVPETGCVLVATEKLDGVRTFERTVVLLLRSGTRHPQEGPFGVVINRPLNKKIKHMKPNNNELATTFSDCSLHFGGPLDASMFLLKTGEKAKLPGFEEVIPGLCFGARSSLDEAAALVKKGVLKPQDFRFFVGYAGWQLDQLRDEIESDYWYVASCSSNLICGSASELASESLWEEILQLMGGDYSELSRKPKQDL